MDTAGYSGTPLARKLGIKDGYKISIINQPEYYFELFTGLPNKIEIIDDPNVKKDIIHYFVKEGNNLFKDLSILKGQIQKNGMIWISWPKKSSKVITDINEDVIRTLALKNGLVDIKVCAIDEIWSGLKLVIPVKDRTKL
ncbi:MAG TPA: hypothetical protein VGO09_06505 [Flavisolibacter sp.]|jgi:hypothetical protein|nr:hypothetical protein [Flavisolibacter sp.]